jgi:phage baseplate assembly protein W
MAGMVASCESERVVMVRNNPYFVKVRYSMLGINAHTGKSLAGLDHLRQSIADILSTPLNTRVMRRDYGSRLPELIDQPITPRLAVELYAATAEALRRWEPRFKLTRVRLSDARAGWVELTLEGEVRLQGFEGQTVTLSGLSIGSTTRGARP